MNIERLDYLATWLENGAKHERITFDLEYGISIKSEDFDPDAPTECKTSCCIAGAAVQFFSEAQELVDLFRQHGPVEYDMWGDADDNSLDWRVIFARGKELLGLTHEQALDLFTPDNNGVTPTSFNLGFYNDPAWAARTIRHLIKTGEVDWEATDLER